MWTSQPATSSSLPLVQELTPKSTRSTAKAPRKWNYVRENIAKAQAKANSDYKATTHSFEQRSHVLYWDLLSWGDFCCDFFILFSAIGFINHLESEDMFLKTDFQALKSQIMSNLRWFLVGEQNFATENNLPKQYFFLSAVSHGEISTFVSGNPKSSVVFCGLAAEIRLGRGLSDSGLSRLLGS